jgi:lipopolysaccharide transport system ATP-binding protein
MKKTNESIAVEVHSLSKKYTLYRGDTGRVDTLRDKIAHRVRRSAQVGRQTKEEFWALKDVSFQVKKGEVLGVIGRNGAGKSTLLKALARVLNPTEGSFQIHGSFSSLLEVGTGFHQELTGRENVYFNGALLGMSKEEISAHFDDIVAYSEIGEFIDMPVKRYSSGMNVRLGFAIAAHLDSDVMIIDEALAVGDAAFRAKSQEVMKKRATSGKTVLFVTHSMSAIQDICDRVIYLEKGRLVAEGTPKDMIELYLGNTIKNYGIEWTNANPLHPEKASPRYMQLQNTSGKALAYSTMSAKEGVRVYCEVNVPKVSNGLFVGISVLNEANTVVFRSIANPDEATASLLQEGLNKLYVDLPLEILKEGDYNVAFDIEQQHKGRLVHPINTDAKTRFTVVENTPKSLVLTNPAHEGVVKPSLVWHKLS